MNSLTKMSKAHKSFVSAEGTTFTTETIWDLSLDQIAQIGAFYEQERAKQGGASYFTTSSNSNLKELDLRIDALKEVFDDKKAAKERDEKLRENRKRQELIAQQSLAATKAVYAAMTPEQLLKEQEKLAKEELALSEE